MGSSPSQEIENISLIYIYIYNITTNYIRIQELHDVIREKD